MACDDIERWNNERQKAVIRAGQVEGVEMSTGRSCLCSSVRNRGRSRANVLYI